MLRDRTELIIRRRKPADEEVEENVPPFRLAMETQEIMPDFVIPRNKNTACLDADKVYYLSRCVNGGRGISLFLSE